MTNIKRVIFSILTITIFGCAKSEDSKPADPTPSVYGNWIYTSPNSTTNKFEGIITIFTSDGKIQNTHQYITANSTTKTIQTYFRRYEGTATLEGENLKITYNYETCNPVGTEEWLIKLDPSNKDRLLVAKKDRSLLFTMERAVTKAHDYTITATEDKGCDILAKNSGKTRAPASNIDILNYILNPRP